MFAKFFEFYWLFHSTEWICEQDHNLHMASLDVDSSFTNISLDETIDFCNVNLYSDSRNPLISPRKIFVIYLT